MIPFGDERSRIGAIGVLLGVTRAPGRLKDLGDHLAFPGHVLDDLLEIGGDDVPTGLDHVLHQLAGIAGERKELKASALHHPAELCVCRDPYPVSPAETLGDGDERLHVSARPDDHDHQIQPGRQVLGRQRTTDRSRTRLLAVQPRRRSIEDPRFAVELER